jgi:hypothetical protein
MTQPTNVRDDDGSQWVLQGDGTYRMRTASGAWSTSYVGYTLQQIIDSFGPLISKTYDDDHGERDFSYLRR